MSSSSSSATPLLLRFAPSTSGLPSRSPAPSPSPNHPSPSASPREPPSRAKTTPTPTSSLSAPTTPCTSPKPAINQDPTEPPAPRLSSVDLSIGLTPSRCDAHCPQQTYPASATGS